MRLFALIFIISLYPGAWSRAELYQPNLLSTEWKLEREEKSCRLSQVIPEFGDAEFFHRTGQQLRFSISEARYKPGISKASLSIYPAPWNHNPVEIMDFSVNQDLGLDIQNYPRLSVYGETAEIMLDALYKGYFPHFRFSRTSTVGFVDETEVAVSSLNYIEKYQQFLDCRRGFLPYGLKDSLEKTFYFNLNSLRIQPARQALLKDTVRFMKELKDVKVVIYSETASAGKIDRPWYRKRAKAIAAKLEQLGISKSRISIKQGVYTAKKSDEVIHFPVFGIDPLRKIYYSKGNTRLTTLEKKRLSLLVRYALEFRADDYVIINSHTDSKGKRSKNLKVSQRRGETIRQHLIDAGLSPDKVKVKAYGESRPVKSNRFPPGRAQNRRVRIDFSTSG